jgi:hypothetical protein
MKTGMKSLVDLANEIERRRASKKDVITSTENLQMVVAEDEKTVEMAASPRIIEALGDFPAKSGINKVAHEQIAQHTGINANYYNRMLADAPDLLATNVNRWFTKEPAQRLVRALDGNVRAVLSNTYRPLENEDLAEAILPVLLEDSDLMIMSCDITERRLYIKAVSKRLERDVPKGHRLGDGSHVFYDTLSPAIIVSNSETGHGLLSVEHGVYTRQCTNLASIADGGMKRRHVGARNALTDGQEIMHLLSDETKKATDKAVWMQVRDVVKNALDEARFEATVKRIAETYERKITGDVQKAVEVTVAQFGMTKTEGSSVLRHLIEGGTLTQYGLFNAVTRAAEDLPDYDRASEFERIGGRMIDMAPDTWKRIAEAA